MFGLSRILLKQNLVISRMAVARIEMEGSKAIENK